MKQRRKYDDVQRTISLCFAYLFPCKSNANSPPIKEKKKREMQFSQFLNKIQDFNIYIYIKDPQ